MNQVRNKLTGIIQAKTILHFLVTSSGTIVTGFLGLLFYVTVARSLGPASYGVLAVALASIAMISDIADLGLDSGIIRFVSKYHEADKILALRFLKLGLEVKLLTWILVLGAGWLATPFIATNFFLKEDLILPLRLSLIGVGGAMLVSLLIHALQAYQKFWSLGFINIFMNSIRLIAISILILIGALNINSTLIIYITAPFLGFLLALLFLPSFIFVKSELSAKKELFHYSKWIAMLGIVAAIGSRLDTFISARLLSSKEVGIYSAANQLTMVVPQIIFALATVVAPKLASFDTDQKVISYLKKLQLLVSGLFIVNILLIPIFILLIPMIYGSSYQESINPFIILLLAQSVVLLALPVHQAIFYYFAKPALFVWISLGQLFITGALGWILISNFGIIGAAFSILVSNLFNFMVSAIWVIYQFSAKHRK